MRKTSSGDGEGAIPPTPLTSRSGVRLLLSLIRCAVPTAVLPSTNKTIMAARELFVAAATLAGVAVAQNTVIAMPFSMSQVRTTEILCLVHIAG